jgi:hypothetical protein
VIPATAQDELNGVEGVKVHELDRLLVNHLLLFDVRVTLPATIPTGSPGDMSVTVTVQELKVMLTMTDPGVHFTSVVVGSNLTVTLYESRLVAWALSPSYFATTLYEPTGAEELNLIEQVAIELNVHSPLLDWQLPDWHDLTR